jgi:hypothetical protein
MSASDGVVSCRYHGARARWRRTPRSGAPASAYQTIVMAWHRGSRRGRSRARPAGCGCAPDPPRLSAWRPQSSSRWPSARRSVRRSARRSHRDGGRHPAGGRSPHASDLDEMAGRPVGPISPEQLAERFESGERLVTQPASRDARSPGTSAERSGSSSARPSRWTRRPLPLRDTSPERWRARGRRAALGGVPTPPRCPAPRAQAAPRGLRRRRRGRRGRRLLAEARRRWRVRRVAPPGSARPSARTGGPR